MENYDSVNITIQTLDGQDPCVVSLPRESTMQDLKTAVGGAKSSGPLNFNLLAEDGTMIGSADCMYQCVADLTDAILTMITESARDYSKITKPETVLQTGDFPNGIAIDKDGNLYVSHYYGQLKVYDGAFKLMREAKIANGCPRQLALAPSGELMVATGDYGTLHVVDPTTLETLRSFGTGTGVAVEGEFVYASSSSEDAINVYNFSDGKLVGTHKPGLSSPQALTVVDGRLLAVADRGNNRIVLLTLDTLKVHSQLPREDDAPKAHRLGSPNDVVVDSGGNLLVMDTKNERIAVFREDGSFVTSIMKGFFKDHGNTFSYLYYNDVTGAIAVSNNDEHNITVLSPIFATESA